MGFLEFLRGPTRRRRPRAGQSEPRAPPPSRDNRSGCPPSSRSSWPRSCGFWSSTSGPSQSRWPRSLTYLDRSRKTLGAELGRPLVMWLPTFVAAELPARSPDLWSWLVDRFVFRADSQHLIALGTQVEAGGSSDRLDFDRERVRLEDVFAELAADSPSAVRGELLVRLADVALMQNRNDDADTFLRDALGIYRGIDDRIGEANTLRSLGNLARWESRYGEAETLLRDAFDIYRRVGDGLGEAGSLLSLARLRRDAGQRDAAAPLYEQAQVMYAELGYSESSDLARDERLALLT